MLSGLDILRKFRPGDVVVLRYIDLLKCKSIFDCLSKSGKLCILYPGTNNETGHWIGVRYDGKEFYYMDSYGGFIDKALGYRSKSMKWNPKNDDYLNKLLFKTGLPVNYNQYQLQSDDPNDSNCGIYVTLFLMFSHLNTDEFAHLLRGTFKQRKNLIEKYFKTLTNYS